MSEEDAISEGETHLSSRRAAASRSVPARSARDAGPYVEERQASHHNAGLCQSLCYGAWIAFEFLTILGNK